MVSDHSPALERLEKAPIDEVTVTNTLPVQQEGMPDKIRVLDISKLLSKAILNIHAEESVSSLFKRRPAAIMHLAS